MHSVRLSKGVEKMKEKREANKCRTLGQLSIVRFPFLPFPRKTIAWLQQRYECIFDSIVCICWCHAASVASFLMSIWPYDDVFVWRVLCVFVMCVTWTRQSSKNQKKFSNGGICYFYRQWSTRLLTAEKISFWIYSPALGNSSLKTRCNATQNSSTEQDLSIFRETCWILLCGPLKWRVIASPAQQNIFADKILIGQHSQFVWLLQNKKNVNRLKFSFYFIFVFSEQRDPFPTDCTNVLLIAAAVDFSNRR